MKSTRLLPTAHQDSRILAHAVRQRMDVFKSRFTGKPISISEVARKAGVERAHLSNFLSGHRQMGSDKLGRVFRVLKLRVRTSKRTIPDPAAAPRASGPVPEVT
jgi:hypothetical protein